MNHMPDDLRTRIAELADQCVMCGLCLPHCPTYMLDANEVESPRGRIRLARALADGDLGSDAATRLPLDHCLHCLNCERVCPSQVRYAELLIHTRALIGPSPQQRPRWLLRLLTRPRLAAPALALTRGLRLSHWLPPLLAHFAPQRTSRLRAALALIPTRPSRTRPQHRTQRANAAAAPTVALFPGCISAVLDAAALDAAKKLLHAVGFRVHSLPPGCCGALDLHDGDSRTAKKHARRVRAHWARQHAEALLAVTPGCLSTLRRSLPDTCVEDVTLFLARHAQSLCFRPLPERVALHFPCTQTHIAHSNTALRSLLERVPQLQVLPVPNAPVCCGAAGSHLITFPERAARLRTIKLEQITELAADRLLSSNIGCRMHLAAGHRVRPTEHPLTLLARQLDSP